NIAAISFLSKRIEHIKFVFWAGLFYTIGRMVAYAIIGFVITYSLLSVPAIANFLQKYMNKVLGPILVIVGLFLLGILKFNLRGFGISKNRLDILTQSGIKGSFVLGFIFALSFCPSSAALFFGSLIPLSLSSEFGLLLPFVYGIGTGLPVIIFSVCIALGIDLIAHWFHKIIKLEIYARRITGIIFILIGSYYILNHIILIR
ncbi:MAG: sulfite exporter TauE/SafE family protein, partial [Candidatus Omnitrophota bacterium]